MIIVAAMTGVGAGMGMSQMVGASGVDGWLQQQQQSTGSKASSTASSSRRGGAVGGPGHREPSSSSTGDRLADRHTTIDLHLLMIYYTNALFDLPIQTILTCTILITILMYHADSPSGCPPPPRRGQFPAGEGSAVDEPGSGGMGASGNRRFSSYVDHGHGSSDESFVAAANAYAGT